MAWSHSRLSDFESCPLMFQHKYVLKTIKFVPNKATERGKDMHLQLERNVVRSVSGADSVPGDVGHVQPIIDKFVTANQEIMVEEQVALNAQMNAVSWFDKSVWVRAVMDLVGRSNITEPTIQQQTMSIIDWKTGQYKINDDQLKLYNMVALHKWNQLESVTSALVFVDHKKISPPVTTLRIDVDPIIDEFSDRSEAIQIAVERDTWPAKKCWKCRWCGVTTCRYVGS